MASNTSQPLAVLLDAAARGRFPPPDGAFDVLPTTGGKADALIAFTGHFVLAADVDPAEVAARAPAGAFDVPLSAPFLHWLAGRIGRQAISHDALLVGLGEPGPPSLALEESTAADSDHPRVVRAARHRDDVRVFETVGRAGVLLLGRGLAGRHEVAYEVAGAARNRGLGRALVSAARRLVPEGEALWAQVAPGNAASLRAALASGFRPVGAEVLFLRA